MSATKQKKRNKVATRRSSRIATNKLTEAELKKLEVKYQTVISSDIIIEKFEQKDNEKKDVMLDMLIEFMDVYSGKQECIHLKVHNTFIFYLNWKKWGSRLGAADNMLSQLVSVDNELLAHEVKMMNEYKDPEIKSTQKLNNAQLKKWRGACKRAFTEKLPYKSVSEGFQGIFLFKSMNRSYILFVILSARINKIILYYIIIN